MWNEVRYEPGEVRVVAYDSEGRPAAERVVRTAGKPYALRLTADRTVLGGRRPRSGLCHGQRRGQGGQSGADGQPGGAFRGRRSGADSSPWPTVIRRRSNRFVSRICICSAVN